MPTKIKLSKMDKKILAYIIGVAIGDGNLSNPNDRAVRLRISCDNNYPKLIERIIIAIKKILPLNKVSIIKRKRNCSDISCYSNKWEGFLGWKAKGGSKFKQKISIPVWIKSENKFIIPCLKGLFETDGSVYIDRKYKMANFVTLIPTVAKDVFAMIEKIGFQPNIQKLKTVNGKIKYTIRISKNTEKFIKKLGLNKN